MTMCNVQCTCACMYMFVYVTWHCSADDNLAKIQAAYGSGSCVLLCINSRPPDSVVLGENPWSRVARHYTVNTDGEVGCFSTCTCMYNVRYTVHVHCTCSCSVMCMCTYMYIVHVLCDCILVHIIFLLTKLQIAESIFCLIRMYTRF